jgi:hypothetical protein
MAAARQLLALWRRLLNDSEFDKVLSGTGNGAFLGIVAHKAGYITRSSPSPTISAVSAWFLLFGPCESIAICFLPVLRLSRRKSWLGTGATL